MGRERNKLTDGFVKTVTEPGLYGDGGNLYLKVVAGGTDARGKPKPSKSWVFRFRLKAQGKTREGGLGRYEAVSLKAAREAATKWREQVGAGIDPIEARKAERVGAVAPMTFRQCADAYIADHEAGWSHPKHRQQWRNTLNTYVHRVIGDVPARAVDTDLVMKVLKPIWWKKPETASRLRGRIEVILDWARVKEGRQNDPNHARWKGQLDQLLPAKNRVHTVEHQASVPYTDIPVFMQKLRTVESVAALALEFGILTGMRSSEFREAEWGRIDLDKKEWTTRIKITSANRPDPYLRVPLSDAALAVLGQMQPATCHWVFPGQSVHKAISDTSVRNVLRHLDYSEADANPHGFRTTFKTWAEETTDFPPHVVEMAIGHVIPAGVQRAYSAGQLFEVRRRLMDAWAGWCGQGTSPARLRGSSAPRAVTA